MFVCGLMLVLCMVGASNEVPIQPAFPALVLVEVNTSSIASAAPINGSMEGKTCDNCETTVFPFADEEYLVQSTDFPSTEEPTTFTSTSEPSPADGPSSPIPDVKNSDSLPGNNNGIQGSVGSITLRKTRRISDRDQKPCCGNINIRNMHNYSVIHKLYENESSENSRKPCCGHIEAEDIPISDLLK